MKLLEHHQKLLEEAKKHNVFVYIEHHKRYDPAYADARFRAQKLGDFNYFYSYMSQPKYAFASLVIIVVFNILHNSTATD